MSQFSDPPDRQFVRRRPSMYLGDLTPRGLHLMVFEVIDYANYRGAKNVSVTLSDDHSVTVQDDGAGRGADDLENCFTKLKHDVSNDMGGLHGIGVAVINFLSEVCDVESVTQGTRIRQSYRQGKPINDVETVTFSKTKGEPTPGLKVSFLPDEEIFQAQQHENRSTQFDFQIVEERIQTLAYLRSGVKYSIIDQRSKMSRSFCFENGVRDLVAKLTKNLEPIHPHILGATSELEPLPFDIALQYSKGIREKIVTYANDTWTFEGGTHLQGFKAGLVRFINRVGVEQGIFKEPVVDVDAFFEGLTAAISLRVSEPQFKGPTRTKLQNVELESKVESVIDDVLKGTLKREPDTITRILRKVALSLEMRTKFPPLDRQIRLGIQQRKLMRADEFPTQARATPNFPSSYCKRMRKRNGGQIQIGNELWTLFQFDFGQWPKESNPDRQYVVEQSLNARKNFDIPDDALVIASNDHGDFLLFVRKTGCPSGKENPNAVPGFAGKLYRWDHRTHDLSVAADDFDEVAWGKDPGE